MEWECDEQVCNKHKCEFNQSIDKCEHNMHLTIEKRLEEITMHFVPANQLNTYMLIKIRYYFVHNWSSVDESARRYESIDMQLLFDI